MNQSNQPILTIKNLFYRYGNKASEVALNGISFTLHRHQHLTILGHNGSGKSTLGKIIAGLLKDFTGSVELFGRNLRKKKPKLPTSAEVGLIFQNPESQFVGLTVEDDLAFGLENLQVMPHQIMLKIKDIVQQFQLGELFNKESANLSDGAKQKIAIAAVLITKPRLIIFDEPTTMVDQQSEQEINDLIAKIKRQSLSVIEITHDIERLLVADQVLLLENGDVKYFGSAQHLLTKSLDILQKCSGLKLPFFYRLMQKLRTNGIRITSTMQEANLIQQLCRKP